MARDRAAPRQASGDSPSPSTTSVARGSRRAYSSATASGWPGSVSSRLPTTRTGDLDLGEPLQPLERRGAGDRAQRVGHRARGGRGAPGADGWPVTAGSRNGSGTRSAPDSSDEGIDVAALQGRRPARPIRPDRPVRGAVVGRRDLHHGLHAAGVRKRERHGGGRAHGAARRRTALEAALVQHRLEVGHQVRIAIGARRPARATTRRARGRRRTPAAARRGGRACASPAARSGGWRSGRAAGPAAGPRPRPRRPGAGRAAAGPRRA